MHAKIVIYLGAECLLNLNLILSDTFCKTFLWLESNHLWLRKDIFNGVSSVSYCLCDANVIHFPFSEPGWSSGNTLDLQ